MPKLKNRLYIFKHLYLQVLGVVLIVLFALLLLWRGNATSNQSEPAMVAQVYFAGEYRIADGPWQEITESKHIPSTKGDVTLRGNFHMLTPDGEYIGVYRGDLPIALYTDHISLTFYEGENEPYIMDVENPLYGSSACGVCWSAYLLTSGSEETIEKLEEKPEEYLEAVKELYERFEEISEDETETVKDELKKEIAQEIADEFGIEVDLLLDEIK